MAYLEALSVYVLCFHCIGVGRILNSASSTLPLSHLCRSRPLLVRPA